MKRMIFGVVTIGLLAAAPASAYQQYDHDCDRHCQQRQREARERHHWQQQQQQQREEDHRHHYNDRY